MASRVKYSYVVELRVLVVEDEPDEVASWLVFKNLSACVVSYALNSIPSASVTFALGTTTTGGDYKKTFQQLLDAVAVRPKKAQIWVTEDEGTRKSVTKVFEGNTGGFGWVRSGTETSLILQLRHWLHWLHAASALTTAMHPASTGDFSRAATETVRLDSLNLDTGNQRAGWVDSRGKPLDVTAAVTADIWGKLIHPFLTDIVNSRQVATHPLATENAYLEQEVKAALAKTNLPPTRNLVGVGTSAPPLALAFLSSANTPRIGKEATAARVFMAIQQMAKSNFHQTTLWAKIVGDFAQQFLFDVVPMVDKAFIVPGIGSYRYKYIKTIALSEQQNVELSGEISQYIRGVVLPFNSEVDTGIRDKSALPFFVFSRAYATYMSHLPGSLLFVPPPFWLANVSGHVSNAAEGQAVSPDPNGAMPPKPVGTTMDEQPAPVPPVDKPAMQIAQALRDNRSMANAWAHQVFNNELLKTRTGTVVTQPRFDIAPGSHVRIALPKELQLQIDDSGDVAAAAERNYLFAKVVQTVVAFDSQKQQASTTFVLSHCRTSAEDKLDDFSIIEPALYNKGWIGGPISEPSSYI